MPAKDSAFLQDASHQLTCTPDTLISLSGPIFSFYYRFPSLTQLSVCLLAVVHPIVAENAGLVSISVPKVVAAGTVTSRDG